MIDAKLLCKKHLLGEHGEIHKHRHNFVKQHSISGRIVPIVQIEPNSMKKRHDDLANEMLRRGMNHQSSYDQPNLSYLPENEQCALVDIQKSLSDLSDRCPECRKNIQEGYNNLIKE